MRKKYLYGLILLLIIPLCSLSFGTKYTRSNLKELGNTAVTTTEIQGAWIIIAGGRTDHNLQNSIDNGCNLTYQILKSRGYIDSDIYYLGNQGKYPTIVDAAATAANIKDAIENWAPLWCSPGYGLGIYMFDHGGINSFCLPSGPDLNASNLAEYLDYFQTFASCNRIIIVYEACHSGSFIGNISKSNRIVITSTTKINSAYPNADLSWAVFSEGFWKAIQNSKTIGQSFQEGVSNVKKCGYSWWQTPWIDDNHDKIGHSVDGSGNLPNNGDGTDALNTKIGTASQNLLKFKVERWPLKQFYSYSPGTPKTLHFWVTLFNETPVKRAYARIFPTGWSPPDNHSDIMEGIPSKYLVALDDSDGDGNYTGSTGTDTTWDSFWNLEEPNLKINYFASDADGFLSEMESTNYSVTSDGNPPLDVTPPTIWISNPAPNAYVSGILNITVGADDDQKVANLSLYIDNICVKTQAMPEYYPFELEYNWNTADNPNMPNNITAVAIDGAGHVSTTTIFVNLPENLVPGFSISTVIIGCFLVILTARQFGLKREKLYLT